MRALRRSPGFTAIAAGTLALGIGVNTAVFTVAKAALFSGFPMVQANDRLLYLSNSNGCCVSYPDFEDWRAQARSFEGMAIVHGASRIVSDPGGFAETYDVTEVSAETFKLTGRQPVLGRDFSTADEIPGAPAVAILSYEFWVRRFAKDPATIGRTVRMNGEPAAVIGVMPQGFSFPQKQDLWVPLVKTGEVMRRDNRGQWFAFGRLKNGATIESARAEMETIGRRLGAAYPATNQGRNLVPVVQTFRDFFILQSETPVYWVMWGAVGFVLLIACANLANLMLARAAGRSGEISVRIALGAGRWRIIRLILLESVVLSALGALLGWWLANWSVRVYALADRGPGRSSWRILDYSMDDRVLWYLAAISIGTAVLFGLAPALRLSRLDINSRLKDGSRGALGGQRGKRLSSLLVTAETALALVLLTGAGLMIRSFWNLYTEDLGVKTSNLLTLSFHLPVAKYPGAEARSAFYDRVQQNLQAIPGVESVALSRGLPAFGGAKLTFELPGEPALDDQHRRAVGGIVVGPDYFKTVGLAVLSGRDFNDRDGASSLPVAIVSERFATELWPEREVLGKRLRVFLRNSPGPWLTVVGVVSDIPRNYDHPETKELVYLPYRQRLSGDPDAWVEGNVIARTRVPPVSLTAAFRHGMQQLDSDLPIFGPLTLDQRLEAYYWTSGLDSALFFIFACVALLLAAVGLYAVVAHSVSQRTREIGVRMAMGAMPRDIIYLIFKEGLLPSGIGLVAGAASSLGLSRILKSQLVQVATADPVVLAVASAVLVVAAMLGCWVPARRAVRVDPVVALRHE